MARQGFSLVRHAENVQVYPEALEPGTEVGRWRVVERLGAGGFGVVYRVEDTASPGTFRALKLARSPVDARAGREVTLLMEKAVHDHVVRFHASGRWPDPRTGFLYIVMDWVDGWSFDAWAEEVNPSFRALVEAACKVARTLDELHRAGVLHRDLKPAHILIRRTDGEPVLIDFGTGDYAGAETVTDQAVPPGTLYVRSPECVRFLRQNHGLPDARYTFQPTDDLYALGVTLYRAVTGHYPFPPRMDPRVLLLVIDGEPPAAPRHLNRRVPRELSDVIQRLMAKDPRERHPTGAELQAALQRAVESTPADAWDARIFEWEPSSGPELPEAAGEVARHHIRRPEWPAPARWYRRWLVPGLSVTVVLAGLLGLSVWTSRTRPEPEPVAREVAPPEVLPEAARATDPPTTVATPVAAAPSAAPADEEESPVTKPSKSSSNSLKRSGLKAASVAGACLHLSCSSPQVRMQPRPPPEACPPDSAETMEELGVEWRVRANVILNVVKGQPHIIPVTAGPVEIRLGNGYGWEGLEGKTMLLGRLIISDRVYGRLTEARTADNRIYPVCMELLGGDLRPGLEREPGGNADTAYVFPTGAVEPVRRFR